MTGKPTTAKSQRPSQLSKEKQQPVVRPGRQHKKFDGVKAVMIALFIALTIRQFVFASYNVPTGSMKDTIKVGDFMFVNKFVYGARTPVWVGVPFTQYGFDTPYYTFPAIVDPQRNDIVVFDYPVEPRLDYIKRCVATGGDVIDFDQGVLTVNGEPEGDITPLGKRYDPEERVTVNYYQVDGANDHDFVIRQRTNRRRNIFRKFAKGEAVPENHFFMMGDNRDNSQDGRDWGYVRRDQVGGKPLIIWLSWNSGDVSASQFYDIIRWERLGQIVR